MPTRPSTPDVARCDHACDDGGPGDLVGETPILYGITSTFDLGWNRYDGWKDGSNTWGRINKAVGSGWSFPRVFSGGDGVIFIINDKAELLVYRHDGVHSGWDKWRYGTKIADSFAYKHVFSVGGGVILAITSDGQLLCWRYAGLEDGSNVWTLQGIPIGRGWDEFQQVFSGGEGVIYAITPNYSLLVSQLADLGNPTSGWKYEQKLIGDGWTFTDVFAAGGGKIFAVTYQGELRYFKFEGLDDGERRWSSMTGAHGQVIMPSWSMIFDRSFADLH